MAGDEWPGQGSSGDVSETIALDLAFDANTLHELRTVVLAKAVAAGLPQARAAEVMLAVHELAANAVLHGGGAGRVRMRAAAADVRCQVSDAGAGGIDGASRGAGTRAAEPWPIQPGRGLWLVRSVTGRLSVRTGPDGSEVTVGFARRGFGAGSADDGSVPASWLPRRNGG